MSLHFEMDGVYRELQDSVRGWAQANLAPGADARDAQSRFDAELYARIDAELGIMNITLPVELDGLGLPVGATVLAIEALAGVDPGIAMSYLSQELLFAHQLYRTWIDTAGSVPPRHADILRAKRISGMAMTEPDAGTDVLGMRTRAETDGDGYVLNGVKQWITNGTVGEHFLVYARTGEGRRDISLFLVPGDAPGLTRTPCAEKMGMRSSPTGVLAFQNCRVPADALVGTLHEGLRPMIRNLAVERVGLAAESVGIARSCMETMRRYAAERRAFGRPIAEFGQVQHRVARSYALVQAMQVMLYDAVRALENGASDASVNADAVKLFCAGAAEEVSRHAIQVLGANGYSTAYGVERLHRDAVLLSIGGGTDEALEKNITRLLTRPAAG